MSLWTIKEAWAAGRDQLAQASASPDLDARLLLEHVLEASHSTLLAHGERLLTPIQSEQYRSLLQRAARKEPIPYLTGQGPFYGLEFMVSPAVLIPRPETEQLVDLALAWAKDHPYTTVVDAGTGSGCIAIALSRTLRPATIVAIDISFAALEIARRNAAALAGQPVHLVQGDLLSCLSGPIDLLVANLPYVAEHEWTLMDDGVKWYEPPVALFAGADGLDLIQALLVAATGRLRPGGAIFLEMGWQQGPALRRLAEDLFPQADVKVIQDLAGHDRIMQIQSK